MSARFEIVRTHAAQPWHARFRAANGRIVWTTETYTRCRGAERAVEAITGSTIIRGRFAVRRSYINWNRGHLTVHYVDERSGS
jgi:uncharacterized protein YegP (UPF0339 family)